MDGSQFVEVSFARTPGEADRLRVLLDHKSIPAFVEANSLLPAQCGIAVLVPRDRLVDATEVLTQMAHDEDEEFEIEDDDEADDDYEDDDEVDFDDDESLGDDDDDFEEEEEDF